MLYYNGTLNGKITTLENNIKTTEAELAKYKKTIAEIARIKKDLKTLENKTKIINTLRKNRKWPITFMDTINDLIIEKRMWVTSLRAKGNNINIHGIAIDNKTVADFMTRLEKSQVYTGVTLKTVGAKKVQKYNLKQFQITCKRKVVKKAPKKTAKPKAKK
ncbi:PilN domain-containing protein [Thermodesulfobacteriota bacterium]